MPVSIFWSLPGNLTEDRITTDWWGLDPVTLPVDEPVTVAEVKIQAQLYGDTGPIGQTNLYDDTIAGYMITARRLIEKRTNRCLLPQAWDLWLNAWPRSRLFIPRAPLRSVAYLQYTDVSETVNVTDPGTYDVNTTGDPGSIVLRYGQIWPPGPLSPSRPINARFEAGYNRVAGTGAAAVNNGDGSVTLTAAPATFDPTWTALTRITLASPATGGNGLPQRIYSVAPAGDSLVLSPPSAWNRISDGAYDWNVNSVPEDLRDAIKILAAHLFYKREPIAAGRDLDSMAIERVIDSLIDPYRVNTVGFNQMRAA